MAKILALQTMQPAEDGGGGLTVSSCSVDCSANPDCGVGQYGMEQMLSTCSIGCDT